MGELWMRKASDISTEWIILRVLGLIFTIFFYSAILYCLYYNTIDLNGNLADGINSMGSILWISVMILFVISTIIWIFSIRNPLKIMKVKKYKENWLWEVKLLKVTAIKQDWEQHVYYAEAKDGDIIYCSNGYFEWDMWWIPRERMEEIYRKYWFEFDENETYKQEVLGEIDRRIEELQYETKNNEWYFKNQITKYTLYTDKKEKNIVEEWYEPAYWEVDWHRITVWDTVTVYIDPENPKYYWMDIDFLFEK